MKRLKKEIERRKVEDQEDEGERDIEAQMRAVEDFEMVQAGLGVRQGGKSGDRIVGRQAGKIIVERVVEEDNNPTKTGSGGTKRKFEIDEDELRKLATDERDTIKRRIIAERNGKSELPSFWVPGETPSNQKSDLKKTKLHPTCPAAETDKPHDFTLKSLVAVKFTGEEKSQSESKSSDKEAGDADGDKNAARSCPACNKALSNSTKAVLAKPCGHVLCKPCSNRFQKAKEKNVHDEGEGGEEEGTVRCYVCQEDVTAGRKIKKGKKDNAEGKEGKGGERGLVELSCEGTGFAGGGKNMVKKGGLSFQC